MIPKLKEFIKDSADKTAGIFLMLIGIFIDPIFSYLLQRKRIRLKIANDISVNSEWNEITLQSPLKIQRKLQVVLLHIEGCWREQYGKEYKLSDGTIIHPNIEILDEERNEFSLEPKMCLAECLPDLTWRVEEIGFCGVPPDRDFTGLKIRSDIPFQCSLSWYDYELK